MSKEGSKQLPKPFFRRVIHTTNGRLINLTPIIPEDWENVEIKLQHKDSWSFTITAVKLVRGINHAQSPTSNQPDKQDTSETR